MLDWAVWGAGLGVGAWGVGVTTLACAQRRLIFRAPTHIRSLPPGPWADAFDIEPLTFEVAPGVRLQGWRSWPKDGAPRGTLLHFGGRGEHVAWAPHMSGWLPGWSVLCFNYRGFGASTGRPGEAAVMGDALAIHARWIAPLGAGHDLVLSGRSLGSAVAVRTAAAIGPRALLLFSPLCSVTALLRGRPLLAPARWLLRHPMDALSSAGQVHCPTLVLLAPGDRQIPNAHSERLAAALRGPVTIHPVPGSAHRTLPRSAQTQAALTAFFQAQGLIAAARG
jgi:alpha-beta hydrolase superfamily lysophospholipase